MCIASACSDDASGEGEGETSSTSTSSSGTSSTGTTGTTGSSGTTGTTTQTSTTTTTTTTNTSNPCAQDDECGPGQICLGRECVDGCRVDTDCAQNEYCLRQECVRIGEGCREDGDCNVGEVCDVQELRCVSDDGSCRDDLAEPNENLAEATPLALGTQEGLNLCPGDNDYYSLELAAGQTLNASIAFVHEAGNLDLQLLDDRGRPLERSASLDDGEQITYEVTADGTYALRVFSPDGEIANRYDLTVQLSGAGVCEEDANEPNESDRQAVPLAAGSFDLALCSGEDWFSVVLTEDQNFNLTTNSSAPIDLELLAPDGTSVLERGTNQITHTAGEDGAHFVRVSADAIPAEGITYSANIAIGGSSGGGDCTDAFEPNDSEAQASTIDIQDYNNLGLCEDEDDWYAIELGGRDALTVTIDFNASTDVDMRIQDADGAVLDSSTSVSGTESVSITADSAGTYYLQIYHFDGPSVTYSMSMDLTPGPEPPECGDSYEPNNSRGEAVEFPGLGVQNATLCPDDPDYYTVEVTAPGTLLDFEITHDTTFGRPTINLLDANGSSVASSNGFGDTNTIAYIAEEAGIYTLELELAEGETTTYSAVGDVTPPPECAGDGLEPNESAEDATSLTPDAPLEDLVACEDDEDWFVIDFSQGRGEFTVAVAPNAQFGEVNVELYDTDASTVLDSATSNGNTVELTAQVLEAGVYYARVTPADGTFATSYDISLSVVDLSVCFDALEPNNTREEAVLIEPDIYPSLTVCNEIDEDDFYAIELNARDVITIDVLFSDATADLDLQFLSPTGSILRSSGSTTDNESIEFEITESGLHAIRVYHFSGDPNTYTLDVSVDRFEIPECLDTFGEEDDTPQDAQSVSAGSFAGEVCFEDEDWFAIEGIPGQILVADLQFTHADGNLDLEIVGPDGTTVLREGSSTDDNEQLAVRTTTDETYFVRILPVETDTNFYILDLSFTDTPPVGPCSDRFEPNNTRAEATVLDTGLYEELDLCDTEDDDDFYALELSTGDVVTVDLFFVDATADIDLQFLNSDGDILERSGSSTDDETITFTAEEAGTYFIRAYHFSGSPNTYSMDIDIDRFEPPTCDDVTGEDDDSPQEAQVVVEGSYTGQVCFEDEDWFAIAGTPGLILVADLQFTHADGNLDLEIVSPDGTTVLASGSSTDDNEVSSIRTDTDETYFVRVFPQGRDLNNYTLDLSFTDTPPVGPCSDRFEPNNTFGAAFPLEAGAYEELDLCATEDDDDFYAVSLQTGDELSVEILFTDATADLDLQVLAPDGTTSLASSTSTSDDEAVSIIAQESGVFFIRAYHYSGSPNTYTLNIDIAPFEAPACEDDDLEDNDTSASATFLNTNQESISGQICFVDPDWFAIIAGPGDTIEATLVADVDTGNLDLALYRDANLELLDSSTNSFSDTDTVSFDVTEEDIYYIEVSPNGEAQNAYTLDVSLTPAP